MHSTAPFGAAARMIVRSSPRRVRAGSGIRAKYPSTVSARGGPLMAEARLAVDFFFMAVISLPRIGNHFEIRTRSLDDDLRPALVDSSKIDKVAAHADRTRAGF